MIFLKSKKGKEAFENAVIEMVKNNVNKIEFSPINDGILLLIKDGTEESQAKQANPASIIGFVEKDGIKYLVCRK